MASNLQRGNVPDPVTGMYVLKRAIRSDPLQSRLGDVVPLDRVVLPVQLVPRFGQAADPRLTAETSLEYSTECFLNKYFNKVVFQFIHNK